MPSSLVGMKLRFLAGEPWDFHAYVPVEDCIGEVTSAVRGDPDMITVKWVFRFEGKDYAYGVMSNRHVGFRDLINRLLRKETVHCSMLFFPPTSETGQKLTLMSQAELYKLMNTSGVDALGFIGSVQLASMPSLIP